MSRSPRRNSRSTPWRLITEELERRYLLAADLSAVSALPNTDIGPTQLDVFESDPPPPPEPLVLNDLVFRPRVPAGDDRDNDALPIAIDDAIARRRDETIVIDILANDEDPDGVLVPSSVTIVDPPSFAEEFFVDPTTGTVRYTANHQQVLDRFSYRFRDERGNVSNVAEVILAPPIDARDDFVLLAASQTPVIVDALFNDASPLGPLVPREIVIVDPPRHALDLTVDLRTGAMTYFPDGNRQSDTFTYVIRDAFGVLSNRATVSIDPPETPPFAEDLVIGLESDHGVQTTDGVVTGWLDGSAANNHLTATGGPVVTAVTPTGQPALALDGSDDRLRRTQSEGLQGLPAGGADRAAFSVVRYVDTGDGFSGVVYGKDTSNRAFGLVSAPQSGNLAIQGLDADNDLISTQPGVGAGWLVQSAVLRDDTLTHFQDGQAIDQWQHSYQTRVDAPQSQLVIGESITGNEFGQFDLAAYFLYDRGLKPVEHQRVNAYLSGKYTRVNRPPTAVDDQFRVDASQIIEVNILANDFDHDSTLDMSSVTIVTPPEFAQAEVDPLSGNITYAHDGSTLPDRFPTRLAMSSGRFRTSHRHCASFEYSADGR